MMEYFFLNINYNGRSEVDYWLNEQGLAPIFYGNATIEQIKNNKGHKLTSQQYQDAKRFIDTFSIMNSNAIICSIGNEYTYIYKQDGPLQEYGKYKLPNGDLVKAVKIKLIKKEKIKNCPLILVSIKANRYIASGTFKNLSHERYSGNSKALDFLIERKLVRVSNFAEYLKCLSSIEFETLIAKYLEESGLFVPAYKGGFIRNYDLFCRNMTVKDIKIDKIIVKPKESISVQIKLHLPRNAHSAGTDYFFCIFSDVSADNIYDHEYIRRNLEKAPATKKWLENSLYWIDPKI